ncbi:hypothetical protein Tco_1366667, partial [Tanacetum coccineum]
MAVIWRRNKRLEDTWWGEFQLDQQLAMKSGAESQLSTGIQFTA